MGKISETERLKMAVQKARLERQNKEREVLERVLPHSKEICNYEKKLDGSPDGAKTILYGGRRSIVSKDKIYYLRDEVVPLKSLYYPSKDFQTSFIQYLDDNID